MRGLVIVVPVYNEAETIGRVVAGASGHAPVIVVDDGSSDESSAEAAQAGAQVIRHSRRRGKAAALRTGFDAARARGAAVVLTLDGDGQHAIDDVPMLLRAVGETPDRLVVGNRLGEAARFPRARLNAMEVAAFFVEWVTALGMRDTQSGFRAYPVALLDDVGGHRDGFVFETEVLVAAARRGWRVREVAVASIPSARRRSRFRPVRDGVAIGAYLTGQALLRWTQEIRESAASRSIGSAWAGRHDSAQRRRERAALATAVTPLLLGAAVLQVALGWTGLDLVTPLVRRFFTCERLAHSIVEGTPDSAPNPEATPSLAAPRASGL